MSHRVTNFDQEIFSSSSGFQSVRANTLPGRTLDLEWFQSTWPRIPPIFNTVGGEVTKHRASVFSPVFFEAPQVPAEITEKDGCKVVRLTSDMFLTAKPRVQVRGAQLHVHARRFKSVEGVSRMVRKDDVFDYKLDLPGYKLAKMSAKRQGNILTLTIPK
ncbi:hypothetical protein GGI25_000609 [Coemansia spiralis]|uniref:SHSP domain-containing protein n=2 Tax=Coemansia TaxID=4863 RepID=A0A9W8GE48_9FUNG|nr:hypothetical protein BX070DRAFT_247838 [Coemansia spiralis]KAJ1996066.1 hypothetical protein EDC05_000434 [Coemansia umbellata]KAJ2625509.1 hypothetical protein GGI26_000649 [Coemansia sp. RSA 1358]KAJ2680636.1 hypothetical protein GGI25_000609 [Coemansia spiralis]